MNFIEGIICALVTPFKDGKIDISTLKELIEFHISQETDALLLAGSTGESATLTFDERRELFEKAMEFAAGRIPLIAGCGTNHTRTTIEYVNMAEDLGYEIVLLVCPYYNKPSQKGLFEHFKEVSSHTSSGIILYNVPGRTGSNLTPETVYQLVNTCENIIGLKEASKNLDQMMALLSLLSRDRISLLSGDDAWTFPLIALGYRGVVSVFANLFPEPLKKMFGYLKENKIEEAREIHEKYLPLMNALFIETNPVPVKTAMQYLGWISGEVRLPLSPMLEENEKKLVSILRNYSFPNFK